MRRTLSLFLSFVMVCLLCGAAGISSAAATPSLTVTPTTLNITVGQSGTVTWTTNPATAMSYVSPVNLSHTNYSQSSNKITFTGRSVGTDSVYIVMEYSGKTYTKLVTVNVTARTLSSIAVTTKPTKTSYYVGDTLNTAGMVVQATYSDGTKSNVTGYTCSPTTLNTAGTQTVTVSYKEGTVTKTATFTVSVATPSITVSPATLNLALGASGTVTYTTVPANQSVYVQFISLSHTNYSQSAGKLTFTGNSAGKDQLYLVMEYGGKEYKSLVTVNVTARTLSSIAVTTKPTKTSYYVGDTLNTAGMVVQATYSGGTKSNVTGYTCSPTTLNTAGTQTVTVSYKEGTVTKTTTFTVSVAALSITVSPATLNLTVGASGTVTYTTVPANQSVYVQFISLSHTNYSQSAGKLTFTGNSAGKDQLYLVMEYGGKEYKSLVTVNVTARTLSSIAVTTKPTKTSYYVGDTLNTAGMVVQATYSNGTKSNVTGYTCSPTTLNTAGTQTVTVSYKEGTVTKTTTFTVSVQKPQLNCTLTLSKSSLSFKKGESGSVLCSYTISGDYSALNSVEITYSLSADIAKAQFGDWQTDSGTQNSIPLTVYGTAVGSATLTVQLSDPDSGKVLAQASLALTVTQPDPFSCTLTLSKNSLTLQQGASATVDCAYVFSGDTSFIQSINIGYLAGVDENIVGIRFGNWSGSEFSHNSIPVTITGKANGTTTVDLVVYDTTTNEIYARQALTVTVGSPRMAGDVNGDGKVTLIDAALISRFVVGGWGVTLNESAADVNGDNKVTLIDAALISRYVVGGWGVVLK